MTGSAILAKVGLPVLVNIFTEVLSGSNNPVAKGASEALERFNEALMHGEVSTEELSEMNRHTENLARLKSEEYRTQISEINQSLRAEVASNDPYVRRMRPTFGYLMAITWAAQMLALAWVILDDPSNASLIMEGFESLGVIWTVGLSVLGIYVYKRSEDKKTLFEEGRTWSTSVHDPKMRYIESIPDPVAVQMQSSPPPRGRI